MAQRQGDESDQLKVFQQIVCAHLQNRDSSGRAAKRRQKKGCGKPVVVGKYREEEPWKQRTAAGRTIGVSVLKAGTGR